MGRTKQSELNLGIRYLHLYFLFGGREFNHCVIINYYLINQKQYPMRKINLTLKKSKVK